MLICNCRATQDLCDPIMSEQEVLSWNPWRTYSSQYCIGLMAANRVGVRGISALHECAFVEGRHNTYHPTAKSSVSCAGSLDDSTTGC